MTAQPDQIDERWTYEHDRVLDQVLGKKAARAERLRIYLSVPCVGCGATSGNPCVTDRDVPVQPRDAIHMSRRRNEDARARWQAFVVDQVDHVIEERRANRESTRIVNAPTHEPLRMKPRLRLRLKSERAALAVRLGDAAAEVERLRRDEGEAWLAAERLSIELAAAEHTYALLLAEATTAIVHGRPDALMEGPSS